MIIDTGRNTAEFEYSVIGAICIDNRIIEKISPILQAEDFTITTCADIYEAACDAASRGKSFDAVYAADVISSQMIRAREFIDDCMKLCPSCSNAEFHAKEIHKRAQVKKLTTEINEKMFGLDFADVNPQDLAADIASTCQNFLIGECSSRYSTMTDAVSKVYSRVTNPQKEERIDTGYAKLDSMLKGMPKGNLVFIGARPSIGKSAFALSIAEHVAKVNGTVMLYSLEMLDEECAERSVAKASNIEMDKLIDCNVEEKEFIKLSDACGRLSRLPIKIFDTPNVTPSAVRRDARMFKDIKLIIIDFISLMASDKKTPQNRNLELGAISRDLKNLAVELDVPILVLSQLSRNKDDKTEPVLSDLRDSGELEQNANKVMFLWQLEAFPDGTKEVGVSVAKNRRGRLGAVRMDFNGAYMRFDEIDYLQEIERKSTSHSKYGDGIIS